MYSLSFCYEVFPGFATLDIEALWASSSVKVVRYALHKAAMFVADYGDI